MIEFNGDLVFNDTSGQIRTDAGPLTLRADGTGTQEIIFGSGLNVRPDRNARMPFGTPVFRWSTMHGSSGIFNTISPPTSGSFIDVAGSLLPNRSSIYALGTDLRRWAYTSIVSGVFDVLSANDMTVDQILTLRADGFTINSLGALTWDASSAAITFTNCSLITFPTEMTVPFGTFSSEGTSTTFAKRPTVNGSGVALANENYYEVYGGRLLDLGATVANGLLTVDASAGAVSNGDDHFLTVGNARLIHYAVSTQTINATQPSGWVIRMRLDERSEFHASGNIYFAAGSLVNGRFVGKWAGNTHIPSGSRVRLSLDNDGGPTANIVFAKAWVGLAVSGTI